MLLTPSEKARASRDGQRAMATTTVALIVVIVVLVGAVAYLGAMTSSSRMSSTTPSSMSGCSAASMEASTASVSSFARISENATTADYKLMLVVAPPEQMLEMCQFTNQTSGMVMVAGNMSTMGSNMSSMNMVHLVVHVYDKSTGATVIPPVDDVSVTVTNSSAMSRSVPVVEMFGAGQGVSSMHYGNNVSLAPGTYTVTVTVMGETATFDVTVS